MEGFEKFAKVGKTMAKAGLIGWGLASWTKFAYKAGMEAERERMANQAAEVFEQVKAGTAMIDWNDPRLSPRLRNLPPESKQRVEEIIDSMKVGRRDA